MVRRFLTAVGSPIRGMHAAAYVLAGAALLSQLLGLFRDRLLASSFGVGETLDLYYASFRVPDLLFATVASLLSLYALLPVLSRVGKEPGSATLFLERALLVFFVVMGLIAGALYVVAPALLVLVAPGLAGEELTALTRILLLQPILLGASNLLSSLTQLRNRFVLYSVSPLLYNAGIIIGIVFFYPLWGLSGLAWGVVLGALFHVLIQVPFFREERGAQALPIVPWRETMQELREVLTLSVPRTAALSMGQIGMLILIAIASVLSVGSISVFMFAWNLQAVPLAVIGVSYSVAAFPTLSRLHAQGQQQEFLQHIETALRHILFWAIPATILVIVLRAQLVRSILGSGAFDWDATRLTAAALALFAVSLSAQSITLLLSRAYYASGRTVVPFLSALAGLVTISFSALLLVSVFHSSAFTRSFIESLLRVGDIAGTTVLMLALAYCLGALVQCIFTLRSFYKDFGFSYASVRRLFFQSFSAGVLGGAVSYALLSFSGNFIDINTTLGIVLQGFGAGVGGLAVTALVLVLLGNEEIAEAYGALRRRMAPEATVLEQTDVSS